MFPLDNDDGAIETATRSRLATPTSYTRRRRREHLHTVDSVSACTCVLMPSPKLISPTLFIAWLSPSLPNLIFSFIASLASSPHIAVVLPCALAFALFLLLSDNNARTSLPLDLATTFIRLAFVSPGPSFNDDDAMTATCSCHVATIVAALVTFA